MPSGRGYFCFAKSSQKQCVDERSLRACRHSGSPAMLARRGTGDNSACGLKHVALSPAPGCASRRAQRRNQQM